jgi:hypothetical protein
MTSVKPGDHLRSRVSATEVIVVKAPSVPVAIACGGKPMAFKSELAATEGANGAEPVTLLGKRYADDDLGLELLCVKGGAGQLTVDGRELRLREARPLPASD